MQRKTKIEMAYDIITQPETYISLRNWANKIGVDVATMSYIAGQIRKRSINSKLQKETIKGEAFYWYGQKPIPKERALGWTSSSLNT